MPVQVRRMMVLASLKTVAVGLAIGLLASLGLGGAMRGLLFGVQPTSPAVYAAAIAVLAGAAALASWFAAGRVARITPMDALRTE
jgi:putative ABC transport system permease protein